MSNTKGTLSETGDSDHTVVPVNEAVKIVRSITHLTGTETIPLDDAEGRTLAELVISPADLPGYSRSGLNGYAVISADTRYASRESPSVLSLAGTVHKGRNAQIQLRQGQAVRIETGGLLPEHADAVVREEESNLQSGYLYLNKPVLVGENLIRKDEDFYKGEHVYPAGWILRPQDIGVLAAIGKTRVTVRKKPVIGIISTGKELIPAEAVPETGQVREVNSYLIAAFCRRQGAIPVRYGIVRDDEEELTMLLSKAAGECDAVIVSGGSARDQNDVTARVVRKFGKVFAESISFAPEKRTTIGRVNSVLVLGLPGHPSATFMVLVLVVVHLIQALKGSPCQRTFRKTVRLTDTLYAEKDKDRYIRLMFREDSGVPVFGKAGLINLLAMSDGLVRVPAGSPGFHAGEQVEVMIW
jgi:molybdopterin molybdotransferase